jgi:DNA-binding CsgD family transcriptional regulator/GAF domain-containing protein
LEKGNLVETIDQIYAAAGKTEGWSGVLQSIIRATGASSGCILSTVQNGASGNVSISHEIDPDWIQRYNNELFRYDPSPALIQDNPGRVVADAVTGPRPADLTGDARLFYNELMLPQSFRHTLHSGLFDGGQRNLGIILQRPSRPGAFSAAQVATLQSLTPHLNRALILHARLQAVDQMVSGLAVLLDRMPMGVVLLNGMSNIVHANNRAQQVLRSSSLLRSSNQRLQASGARDNRQLQGLIAAALARESAFTDTMLRLLSGGPPGLYIQVTPMELPEPSDSLFLCGVRAAVWIGAYEPDQLCPRSLAKLYNLSPTESELLVRLVDGTSLSEIAGLRQVSIYTVRTQLKTIMNKLNVSRQADLVRLVMSGPGAILPE